MRQATAPFEDLRSYLHTDFDPIGIAFTAVANVRASGVVQGLGSRTAVTARSKCRSVLAVATARCVSRSKGVRSFSATVTSGAVAGSGGKYSSERPRRPEPAATPA